MPSVNARGMAARFRPGESLQPTPLSPRRGFMAAAALGRWVSPNRRFTMLNSARITVGFSAKSFLVVLTLVLLMAPTLVQGQALGDKAKLNNVVLFDGSRFDPESITGKVTLLYFWASWCPICRKEMPVVQKHYVTYRDQGFTVLAINFRDKEENAKALLREVAPIDFPVGVINDEYRSDYPKLYGTPTWYLIDRSGVIKKVVIGEQTITGGWFDGLKKELEAALAKKAPE
jgi:thiol-disulfide isomerase/thioredoxin